MGGAVRTNVGEAFIKICNITRATDEGDKTEIKMRVIKPNENPFFLFITPTPCRLAKVKTKLRFMKRRKKKNMGGGLI